MKIRFITGTLVFVMSMGTALAQLTGTDSTLTSEDKIFERVEVEAEYPGGAPAWLRFLTKTVDGYTPSNNNAPSGTYTVVIQFVVDKDSSITEFKALTNHGYGMEKEVIRALRLSGKWSPAIQNGKPIKAFRKQPVTFRVELEGMKIETEKPDILLLHKDNPVTISVKKMKDDDLQVTVSHGTVTKAGNGKYMIKLTKKDRVIIRVYNRKKDQEIGSAIYDVRE